MPIQWSPEYSVNVKEIDTQHQYFIGIINELYSAIKSLRTKQELGGILDKLIAYARNHFDTEEKYFDLYHYENAEEHKQKHQELFGQATTIQEKFKLGQADVTLELVDFLENWLVDHLDNQDKKYTECFNKNGLF